MVDEKSLRLRAVAVDMVELSLQAFDDICKLEFEETKGAPNVQFLLNRAISIAGNARLKMAYMAQDAVEGRKES